MGVFVHPQGLCESAAIGDGSRVWAFAHVLAGAVIGRDANICDHVFVENDVILGDRVTVKSGVQLWDGVRLSDDVFVGPNVTFTNDPFPRSKAHPDAYSPTTVMSGASIGANATLLPGVTVGPGSMIGAGSVVTHDVPPHAVVAGNPARVVRFVTTETVLEKAKPIELKLAEDSRGNLVVCEFADQLDFEPQRFFSVSGVPEGAVRGLHAHRACEQVLLCLHGMVTCFVDDGFGRAEYTLDRPNRGLHVPAMVWGSQYRFSEDAVLSVFASLPYDADDYISDYQDFVDGVRRR